MAAYTGASYRHGRNAEDLAGNRRHLRPLCRARTPTLVAVFSREMKSRRRPVVVIGYPLAAAFRGLPNITANRSRCDKLYDPGVDAGE